MKKQNKQANHAIRIFTDGSGCRPDGKGSKFAWLREDNGSRKITPMDALTNNQAEYKAILSAIESLERGTSAEILTDSENTCFQLRGERRVKDSHLAELNAEIQAAITKNHLKVIFTWIPRRDNVGRKADLTWMPKIQLVF
jgi:ribonuclease HI